MSRIHSLVALCACLLVVHSVGALRLSGMKSAMRAQSESQSQVAVKGNIASVAMNVHLAQGSTLTSPAGRYQATMTSTCNFIVQDTLLFFLPPQTIWATGTFGQTNCYIVPQSDTNLCIYNGNNQYIWCTMQLVQGAPSPYKLVLTDAGQLAMQDAKGNLIWGSNENTLDMGRKLENGVTLISSAGRYALNMGTDCNLVLSDGWNGNKLVWSSNTSGKGTGCFAVQQTDTNFCIYTGAGAYVWCTMVLNYGAPSPYRIVVSDTGVLTQYDKNGKTYWTS